MTVLNYSAFDFDTIKTSLINILQDDPVFNDYNFAGSHINTIIELIAGVGDLFNFYINATADESFISSAELYKNINKLVELIGYNPNGYKTATVTARLQATIDFPETNDYFEIPRWTEFTVNSSSPKGEEIRFVNPSGLSHTGTQGIVNFDEEVYLIQGTVDNETFVGTGEVFQKIELSNEIASEDFLEVDIDEAKWTYVPNLYRGIDNASQVFTTRFDKNERVEIIFGDGIFGVKPPLNSEIVITFIKTLGKDGQIGISEIDALDADIHIKDEDGDDYSTIIDFTIVQLDPSDGGQDPISGERVKNYAPRFFRTQDRAVSALDHEDLLVSGFNEFVSQSVTLNSDEFFTMTGESPGTSGYYYNNVYLYILPRSGNEISGNLRSEIINYLADYKMSTINYVINPIDFINVDIDIAFKTTLATIKTSDEIKNLIENYIRELFTRDNMEIGSQLKFSDIVHDLDEIDGISSLTLAMSSEDSVGWEYQNIDFGAIEFPALNTLAMTHEGTESN